MAAPQKDTSGFFGAIASATGTTKNFVRDVAGTGLAGAGAYFVGSIFSFGLPFVPSVAVGVTTAVLWKKFREDA